MVVFPPFQHKTLKGWGTPRSATLGVEAISRSPDYLHGLIEEVERSARRMANELGAELADAFWDYVGIDQ